MQNLGSTTYIQSKNLTNGNNSYSSSAPIALNISRSRHVTLYL